MFTEVVGGIITALEVYEKRATIKEIFLRTAATILGGKRRVAVFGCGGTGKTTLGNFISGKLDTDKALGAYEETLFIEKFTAKGETPALIAVVPGQEARRPTSWDQLYAELAAGKSFRVINVVAWGYHASGLERARHRVHQAGQTEEEFRAAYFADNRAEELKALRELEPHLKATPGKVRIITLVTKQDLWWKNRQDVEDHYKNGEYSKILNEIERHKGKVNFSHEYASCALVEQNLRMTDGFELALTTQGYDDALRVSNLERAASTINQVIEK